MGGGELDPQFTTSLKEIITLPKAKSDLRLCVSMRAEGEDKARERNPTTTSEVNGRIDLAERRGATNEEGGWPERGEEWKQPTRLEP